jgi:ribosomal protein S3AE
MIKEAASQKMTFRELDTMLNKLIDDFEQQQSTFKQQVDNVNAYDLILADNEEKVC